MPGPVVNLYPIPSGGAVRIECPEYDDPPVNVSTMTIAIATSGISGLSTFTQIYSGSLLPQYLDVGDLYPQPLDPTVLYVYQVGDDRGVTQTQPVLPAWNITNTTDQLSQILIRLLQGAVNSMPLPAGVQKTIVTTQMPSNGWAAMPFIIVNLELIQQSEVALGADAPTITKGNQWTLFANAKRIWRITIMSVTSDEGDFYRDALIAALRVMRATAFGPLGFDVSHAIQAASYTDAKEFQGQAPGFYGTDIMFEINGMFPVTILGSYKAINTITATATIEPPPGATTIAVEVP